ncbi:M15 family metallopeptidase [Aliivibrio sp. S2TY2]|uniref:M15 family metallopeptidase n=1 Tax=unclassified Aliivibrio TaxID=2645654 RepID=UPI00237938A0|nr:MULTISPECIES: M15 family metallopeptidase [unclassified Aliivibrio]MDD9174497.1 M15 family metallopeptidase [Aliivibrio sp. S3TY1]MDD9191575.1 M15 family metallopeptidase [Aliivibrio sp. S2TY2]
MYHLGKKSLSHLHKVHPRFAACIALAATVSTVDFSVSETIRTSDRQRELFYGTPKRSWTLNSKHLLQDDGYGHAADLIPLKKGGGADWDRCAEVKDAMFKAAELIGIRIRWGGDWNQNGSSADEHQRGSYDGPHFEYLGLA